MTYQDTDPILAPKSSEGSQVSYVRSVVEKTAETAPTAVALLELDGRSWTFADLSEEVSRYAAEIPEGARRIAVHAGNDNDSVARICAVWRSGASAVLLGALLPDAEAERRVRESFCDAVLGRPGVTATLAPGQSPAEPDEALVVFTSGTTGRPKGTVLTVDGLGRSLQGIALGSGLPRQGRSPADPPRRLSPMFTPMAHMAGMLGVLSGWYVGKPVLIVPKFDAKVALRLVDEFGVNVLRLTPAMVYDLARWPDQRDLGGVRSVTVGTAAIPDATRVEFERRYGLPVHRNYGQTEFSGAIAFERPDDVAAGRRPEGTVGRIAPGVEVRIVSPEGADLGPGEIGEIVARGGGSMAGYIGADGRPISPGPQGWVHTGDLGTLDADGFLFVRGRLREMLICGGFNVYPAVVEAALNKLPGVIDSAVAGAPDERLGEVPVAVVVADDELGQVADLQTALRNDLARYEIPRRIVRVPALPRTENGKVDRPGVLRLITTGD
jgi:fatty-acyl-CoA synthase/O-succinylbenzoic acid--CoA ligase